MILLLFPKSTTVLHTVILLHLRGYVLTDYFPKAKNYRRLLLEKSTEVNIIFYNCMFSPHPINIRKTTRVQIHPASS